jgi:hypothetical protein
MTTHIEADMEECKHSIKTIILNMPKAHYLAYEMKATDSIPIYCLHADTYPTMATSQKEIMYRLSGFYMMASSSPDDMEQHIQQSDVSTNVQALYNLATHFIRKEPRDDESDPYYQDGMEIIKQECKNIVDILEQDSETWNFRSLMRIYIPRTTGVADEDKPYLDWMQTLIHDLLTARPV